jgi:hypothetical protein
MGEKKRHMGLHGRVADNFPIIWSFGVPFLHRTINGSKSFWRELCEKKRDGVCPGGGGGGVPPYRIRAIESK